MNVYSLIKGDFDNVALVSFLNVYDVIEGVLIYVYGAIMWRFSYYIFNDVDL